VGVDVQGIRLDDALDKIGQAGKFSFSYNAALLPIDSLVEVHARGLPVRTVAGDLLGPRYLLRPVGNHVVIRRVDLDPEDMQPKYSDIEGYLIDATTGEKVRFATVYENARRTSVLSDPDGHYQIRVPGQIRQVELVMSKRGYRDTVLVVDPVRMGSLTVGLQQDAAFHQVIAARRVSSVGLKAQENLPLVGLLVPESQQNLAANIDTSLRSFPFQISILPALGTNKLLSGGMDNNFSLNVLAGYCNGVNGVEVGGLVNLDRGNMRGVQVGGLVNVVGGNVSGLQVGGLVNYVKGEVTGLQVAGLVNCSPTIVRGAQIAGLVNYVPAEVTDFQVGGIVNVAKGNVGGGQASGVLNYADGNVGGGQIGGMLNFAKGNVGGCQITGLMNHAEGNVGGFQISGIGNQAKGDVDGFQIGGIFNRARTVKGSQIGLVNIADSVGGYVVGIVNVIKKGYKVLEVSRNDVAQLNIAYKTGRPEFYNILQSGWRFGPRHFALIYGAGFGVSRPLVGVLNWSVEMTVNDVIEQGLGPGRLNLWVPTRFSVGIPLGNHFEFYGGLGHHLQVTRPRNGVGDFQSRLVRDPLWQTDGDRTRVQGWLGYQLGLRFVL
jgi:hypothetical protein